MLTSRQEKILATLVREYTRTAEPIASSNLVRSKALNFSSATVRNDLAVLDESGYISQPHTSAGRVPTNKGYRYFIDNLMELQELDNALVQKIRKIIVQRKAKETQDLLNELVQVISSHTHNFGFADVTATEQFYTFGFSELVKLPEFNEHKNMMSFARVLDRLHQDLEDLGEAMNARRSWQVFIGTEHPLLEENISVVASQAKLPSGEPMVFGIIGPTRMNYSFHAALMETIIRELLKEYDN